MLSTLMLTLPDPLWRDLRANHAGAAGAVSFYRGMQLAARDPELKAIIGEQVAIEHCHFEFFQRELSNRWRSAWTPVWRGFGWLLGIWSGLFGSQAAYQTIDGVATVLRRHYSQELATLRDIPEAEPLANELAEFEMAAMANRDAVRDQLLEQPSWRIKLWHRLIAAGARLGVSISRRI